MELKWHLEGLKPLLLFHVVAPAEPFQKAQFTLSPAEFVCSALFTCILAILCKAPFYTHFRARKLIAVDHAMTVRINPITYSLTPPDRLRIHAAWPKWTPEIIITHPRPMAPPSSCTPFLCCRETQATMTHNSGTARSTQAAPAMISK
jgi:hypothetical protein